MGFHVLRPEQVSGSAFITGDDAELVRRARARDETAIRAIIRANNQRLYRLVRGLLHDDGEAEDVVQEAYVRAFSSLDGFRGESSLSTWLSRIALNEALGRRRGKGAASLRRTVTVDAATGGRVIPFPLVDPSADPEKVMAQREIQHVVERAVDALPSAFRVVFMARVIEGLTVEETAELLGLKPETVKTRLHRARATLRAHVEKEIGPVLMDAFPFAGQRCERLTAAVIQRLGLNSDKTA